MSFVWCDLSAYRPAAAQAFYADVLGWHVEPGDYPMALAGSDAVAAIYEMPGKFRDMGMPSFWMSYIAVASVADTVARARGAGGRIEVEEAFGPDGRVALIRDPLGAGFTVYEGPMPPGAAGRRPGWRAGHALVVSEATVAGFYADVFGWSVRAGTEGRAFHAGERVVAGLHEAPDAERGGFEYWAVAFAVPDLGRAAATVRARGGEVFGETAYFGAPTLACADMDGAAFCLVAADEGG